MPHATEESEEICGVCMCLSRKAKLSWRVSFLVVRLSRWTETVPRDLFQWASGLCASRPMDCARPSADVPCTSR